MQRELAPAHKNPIDREVLEMIIPIRCFTCGKVVADKYEPFQEAIKAGKSPKEALDGVGLTRYCCRRMILSHADLLDEVIRFSQRS